MDKNFTKSPRKAQKEQGRDLWVSAGDIPHITGGPMYRWTDIQVDRWSPSAEGSSMGERPHSLSAVPADLQFKAWHIWVTVREVFSLGTGCQTTQTEQDESTV